MGSCTSLGVGYCGVAGCGAAGCCIGGEGIAGLAPNCEVSGYDVLITPMASLSIANSQVNKHSTQRVPTKCSASTTLVPGISARCMIITWFKLTINTMLTSTPATGVNVLCPQLI